MLRGYVQISRKAIDSLSAPTMPSRFKLPSYFFNSSVNTDAEEIITISVQKWLSQVTSMQAISIRELNNIFIHNLK